MNTHDDDVFAGLDASETEQGGADGKGGTGDGTADVGDAKTSGEDGDGARPAASADAAKSVADGGTATSAAAETEKTQPASKEAKPEPVVPVARLTAERRQYQEAIQAKDARISEMERRLAALEKPAEQPKPADFLEDPKGYVDEKVKTADQSDRIKKLEDEIEREKQEKEAMQFRQQAISLLRKTESDFVAQTPDYHDALEHARAVRRSQLKIFLPEADEATIEGEMTRQELASAFGMLQQGQNPAEGAYAYARTLGYTPKQAREIAGNQDVTTQPRDGSGKFVETDSDLKARMAAAGTLGSGGNSSAEAEAGMDTEGEIFEAAKREAFGQ